MVVGLLHGAAFLSNLPLVLSVSFVGPQQLERHLLNPTYNNNNDNNNNNNNFSTFCLRLLLNGSISFSNHFCIV